MVLGPAIARLPGATGNLAIAGPDGRVRNSTVIAGSAPVCRRGAPSGSLCSVRAESVMGAARIPLAAVQRRIVLVAAVEDKRSTFAATRLMSGAPRPRKVLRVCGLMAKWALRGRWLP